MTLNLGCLACGNKGGRYERVGPINKWGKPRLLWVTCQECEPPGGGYFPVLGKYAETRSISRDLRRK